MTDIVKLDQEKLITLLKNTSGLELKKLFENQIYLIDVNIAGTSHIENIQELEPKINKGTHLKFYREPNNPYDELAIVIKDEKDNKLGYIPKSRNEILSRLMDAGKLLYGIVQEKEFVGNWLKVQIQVYLQD